MIAAVPALGNDERSVTAVLEVHVGMSCELLPVEFTGKEELELATVHENDLTVHLMDTSNDLGIGQADTGIHSDLCLVLVKYDLEKLDEVVEGSNGVDLAADARDDVIEVVKAVEMPSEREQALDHAIARAVMEVAMVGAVRGDVVVDVYEFGQERFL